MNHLSSGQVPQATRTRVIVVLVLGQMLGGLGVGSAVSVGALMMAEVSGSPELSGMAATLSTLGAAIASVPLARLAIAKGRGVSLATGSALAAIGAATATIAAVTKATPQPARAAVQGRTDLGMNLAGVVGGLTGGPVLVAIGYSGLAAVAMVPVALIVVTQLTVTARRAGTARPRG